jgi:hypothetical protein
VSPMAWATGASRDETSTSGIVGVSDPGSEHADSNPAKVKINLFIYLILFVPEIL